MTVTTLYSRDFCSPRSVAAAIDLALSQLPEDVDESDVELRGGFEYNRVRLVRVIENDTTTYEIVID